MIAHELHKNMRDAYNSERIRKQAGRKDKGAGNDPMASILAKFGSGLTRK